MNEQQQIQRKNSTSTKLIVDSILLLLAALIMTSWALNTYICFRALHCESGGIGFLVGVLSLILTVIGWFLFLAGLVQKNQKDRKEE